MKVVKNPKTLDEQVFQPETIEEKKQLLEKAQNQREHRWKVQTEK